MRLVKGILEKVQISEIIIIALAMNFNYRNYVKRYTYQPYSWPPDLSLAQLHARCSQPGPINDDGVKCPCCDNSSKRKVREWWKRNIDKDLIDSGTAIPGYFQLIKYYSCFAILSLLLNSLYPIYATYYACSNFDPKHDNCLQVGVLYYLQFNSLIALLRQYGRLDMIDILMILQTTVFYILLAANFFSIIFITFMNDTAKRQLQEAANADSSRCLVFYNIKKDEALDLNKILKQQKEKEININVNVVATMQLYQIKAYYEATKKRNKIYYYLLSLYVAAEDPLKVRNLNKQLQESHEIVLKEKQKLNEFSSKIMVMFQNVETRKQVHKRFRMSLLRKWAVGIRSLLNEANILKFEENQSIQLCTYEIGLGSDILWQNLGEQIGVKMAIRIKTYFVAIFFIVICYIILYYPMLFSLRTHTKVETQRFVKLNTFEKILPNLTAIVLFGLSTYYRIYMDRLSQQRNPKDHLEKAKFVLITCLTFHVLFYIIIPTLFFMIPSEIGETVKLFVISEQAKTFVVIQIIIVVVDLPFRLWHQKKVKSLSDQRIAFKNNQMMLHKIVQCRDYPLEVRLQTLFRLWSLVLFYSFFSPYIVFYVIVGFFILFWIEKRNLYKHYIVRRKISIKLESETLMYFVNFFCVYLCIVYCFTVSDSSIKVIIAVLITVAGLIANIVYWMILNKGEDKMNEIINKNERKTQSLLRKQKTLKVIESFEDSYKSFLELLQNDKLDKEISSYLESVEQYQSERAKIRKTQMIELSQMIQPTSNIEIEPEFVDDNQFTDTEDIKEALQR